MCYNINMDVYIGYNFVFLILGFVFAFWLNLIHYVFIRFLFYHEKD